MFGFTVPFFLLCFPWSANDAGREKVLFYMISDPVAFIFFLVFSVQVEF
jgi:hypothetical protein